MSVIQIARNQKIIMVRETTAGTLVSPAAGDLVIAAGTGQMNQKPNYTNSKEIKNTLDVTERFQGRWEPGNFTIPVYLRPSGTAGSKPSADILFESLMGVKTVNGGTSVAFSQALTKPTFSMWFQQDDMVRWARGCVATDASMDINESADGAEIGFSGQFAEMGWLGTTTISGSHLISATTINLPTDDAKLYKAGGYVEFTDGTTVWDNSGAGYEITAVDYDLDTLTIGTGLEVALDDADTIRPFMPTGTEIGSPLEMRKAYVKFDTVTTTIAGLSLSISSPVDYQKEITQDTYPTDFIPTERNISGVIKKMFRDVDIADFYYGDTNTNRNIEIVIGDTAGSIFTIALPYAEVEFPDINTVNQRIESSINYMAKGSSGEDSCTITAT